MAKDGTKDAAGPAGDGSNDPDAPTATPTWKTAWPFFVALAVVAVLAIGIWVSSALRPADERMSDSAQVQHAINNFYTARNDVDFTAYRDAVCAADASAPGFPTAEEFAAENLESMETNGPIRIPEITDLRVDGDRATAQVHWHFENSEDKTQITSTVVIREGDDWKVCAS